MILRTAKIFVALMAITAAILVIGMFANQPVTAQDQANRDMRVLLETLVRDQASVTILFDKPLVSGEGVWTLPDAAAQRTISQVGTDFLCFSEPWNNTTRERCTPFANLTSISYVTP